MTARLTARPASIALAVTLAAVTWLAIANPGALLTPVEAVILGTVEGITEFLPVSSTGHLVVVEHLLGLRDGTNTSAIDTYTIAIQVGAIAAVASLYRHRLSQTLHGFAGRDPRGRHLAVLLAVAFAPAAIVGLAAGDTIKGHLFGTWPVIVAWVVGGLFLLTWRPPAGRAQLDDLTARHALIIGGAQLLAFWPGTSRSLVTIVAAMAVGATLATAVELSFLLGIITLGAATALDLARHGTQLLHDDGWATPLLGGVVALLTALAAVRWLVTHLDRRTLPAFGWYRLGIAAAALVLLAVGTL